MVTLIILICLDMVLGWIGAIIHVRSERRHGKGITNEDVLVLVIGSTLFGIVIFIGAVVDYLKDSSSGFNRWLHKESRWL